MDLGKKVFLRDFHLKICELEHEKKLNCLHQFNIIDRTKFQRKKFYKRTNLTEWNT